eukprot:6610116-Pyramimonas_sp.AAC.1
MGGGGRCQPGPGANPQQRARLHRVADKPLAHGEAAGAGHGGVRVPQGRGAAQPVRLAPLQLCGAAPPRQHALHAPRQGVQTTNYVRLTKVVGLTD